MNKKVLSVVLAMVCAGVLLVPLIAYATFFVRSTPMTQSVMPGSASSESSDVTEIALGTPIQEALEAGENPATPTGLFNDPVVIGMVIGGIVLLILLVLIIVALARRSKRNRNNAETFSYVEQQSQIQINDSPVANVDEVIPEPVQEPIPEAIPEPVPEAGVTTVLWTEDSTSDNLGTLTRKKNGQSVIIDKDIFAVGKDAINNDFSVSDNSAVSRRHATIRHIGSDMVIEDNNSTNGTFVNGARVAKGQSAIIRNGDVITLANEEFVYSAS